MNLLLATLLVKLCLAGNAFSRCDNPPPPVRDLIGVQYYTDKQKSVIDAEKKKANQANFSTVRRFARGLNSYSEAYCSDPTVREIFAGCAIMWLDSWAKAEALLGEANLRGEYERNWTLNSIGQVYLRIKPTRGLDASAKARIQTWIRKVVEKVQKHFERPGKHIDTLSNHSYWAALSVGTAGVALNDDALWRWALSLYRQGLKQVQTDGSLLLELKRGKRALHYHMFALEPLMAFADLARSKGLDLYNENDGALSRLANKILKTIEDPSEIERAAGSKQDSPESPDYAWMESYYAHFHDPKIFSILRAKRPLIDRRLGGNQTLFYNHESAN